MIRNRHSTAIGVGMTFLYSLSATFPVVKLCQRNIWRASTGLDSFDNRKASWKPVVDCHDSLDCCNTCWETVVLQLDMPNLCVASAVFAFFKMGLQQLLRHSTGSAASKTVLSILYKLSPGFMVVKLCMTIHHRQSTAFSVGMIFLYTLSTTFPVVKMCLWNL